MSCLRRRSCVLPRLKRVQVLEQRHRMNNPTSIRSLFSLPGFVAASRLVGVFGNRSARVLVLRRRKKTARCSQCGHRCRGRYGQRICPCPRPLGWRVPYLRPVRALARPLPAMPRRVRRAPRLAGQEPALYSALRDACGRTFPRDDPHGGGRGGDGASDEFGGRRVRRPRIPCACACHAVLSLPRPRRGTLPTRHRRCACRRQRRARHDR